MADKLVSIMIPSYNAGKTITETLKSILSQTYKNMEIVVIDNSSTDNTVEMVKRFNDPRLRLIVNETNIGGEGNFNKCIETAHGDYIAIYHADDVYLPDIVAKEAAFLRAHPEAGAVFSMAKIIDESGKVVDKFSMPDRLLNKSSYTLQDVFPALLEQGNTFLVCPSAMARRDVYKNDIKEWRYNMFRSASDVDVWLRILEHHTIGIINEPLMNYRQTTTHGSYEYNHMRTDRDDFLIVCDYYISKYSHILVEDDISNYRFYEKKDELKRAIHYILLNDTCSARLRMRAWSDRQTIIKGFSSINNLKIYLAGIIFGFSLKVGVSYAVANLFKRFYR